MLPLPVESARSQIRFAQEYRAHSRVVTSVVLPAILRANVSICLACSGYAVMPAARPWRKEFRLDRLLPASERGPVLRRALRRLAAICRSLAIVRPILVASSSKHRQARELHHRSFHGRPCSRIMLSQSYLSRPMNSLSPR